MAFKLIIFDSDSDNFIAMRSIFSDLRSVTILKVEKMLYLVSVAEAI
jgi:hypothetical protein